MRIVKLEAENFKILKAVEISPDGNMVIIGGRNGQGKSSILDAVWVALAGRSAAPPKPVRKGEEECRIRLDLGEIIITRSFTDKDGKLTDRVKVENADGLRYPSPQKMLDDLLGAIGFDPFEFVQKKPHEQAQQLLQLVPLPVDLEEHARLDASDYAKRRDINRDAAQVEAQFKAIPVQDVPDTIPDRDAIVAKLGDAANHNTSIQREQMRREGVEDSIRRQKTEAERLRSQAAEWTRQAEQALKDAAGFDKNADQIRKELDELPPLPEPIDTDQVRQELQEAEQTLRIIGAMKRRDELVSDYQAKTAQSENLTEAMIERAKARESALAKARMPVDGLGFSVDEKGKPVVTFGGVPFEQASTAEQLRASTAIAMAANPELRVLRIKDGSLLDEDAMAMLAQMAKDEDFQLWLEVVGTGGVGIVVEDGMIKTQEAAEAKPKTKKVSDKPEGTLV